MPLVQPVKVHYVSERCIKIYYEEDDVWDSTEQKWSKKTNEPFAIWRKNLKTNVWMVRAFQGFYNMSPEQISSSITDPVEAIVLSRSNKNIEITSVISHIVRTSAKRMLVKWVGFDKPTWQPMLC